MRHATLHQRMRGAAAIEFALVFIAMWWVVMSCWVAGHVALQRSLVKEAARDAGRMWANAASSELASADEVDLLDGRAEQLLQDALAHSGIQAGPVNIMPVFRTSSHAPSLKAVKVSGQATIVVDVLPAYPFEHTFYFAVEVPHGSRLATP